MGKYDHCKEVRLVKVPTLHIEKCTLEKRHEGKCEFRADDRG